MITIPKSRTHELVVQEHQDETLIYDLATHKAYLLNETAAFVWKSLDGQTEIRTIAADLAKKANSPVSEEIVWLAIEELKKQDLIADADKLPTHFAGVNRREAVKKVGLATMIALPLVSSLVAPTAANAASAAAATCVPVGTCVQARTTGICSTGCTGNVTVQYYNSTDGTCTSPSFSSTLACTLFRGPNVYDLKRIA